MCKHTNLRVASYLKATLIILLHEMSELFHLRLQLSVCASECTRAKQVVVFLNGSVHLFLNMEYVYKVNCQRFSINRRLSTCTVYVVLCNIREYT